jgi:molecular chaperone Hsp33
VLSELHKFLFEGVPVRGMLVRLTDSWRELLRRRGAAGGYPPPLRALLGEMTAAAAMMQATIKFNGALVLQVHGDGPVKLAVAEAQPDLAFRATATVTGEVPDEAPLQALIDVHGRGRCAITLDPRDRQPGQQPYQGVVPLRSNEGQPLGSLAEVLEHYMRQSEQLDTTIVLAADDELAAGLMIQRLPVEGEVNLAQSVADTHEDYRRIAMLAATLKREELLTLDTETLLRRLFWEEPLRRFDDRLEPRFACTCSRERVRRMLHGLGRAEVDSIIAELGAVDIGCEFCGLRYVFDAVDAGELFTAAGNQPPSSSTVQ